MEEYYLPQLITGKSKMTDYEMVSLFNEYETILQSTFINFVTIVFAFLIASYFAADKLSKSMMLVVLAVFTFACLQEGVTFFLFYNEQSALASLFPARESLGWHGASYLGEGTFNFLWAIYFSTIVVGYFGALIFFVHQRRGVGTAD
jgi:hypothetical protein